MLRACWRAGKRTHAFLQRTMPTNVMVARLRARENLKWGAPAMLLGLLYIYLAAVLTTLIDRGWPEWLYLPLMIFIWNGFKFLVLGPVSVVLLAKARIAERSARAKY